MGSPPDDVTQGSDDQTRLAAVSTPASASSLPSATSSSGWLSSSGAIDHGRFPPGTLLGGRYRIVGRLGRGGMGEVYRADDLKLGQPVALKFLPADVDRDAARLMQLHTEVRMARQVSHPNVCRVYDIDEQEGHAFIAMEYVDGEDLSSLLRRVGRFPAERAIELARQLCAGLAAAHERGVIHRDFKPANVMVDGTGKVRITDFGLAGLAGETIRAGTPAYMAPEQLAGDTVTVRSDVYALGLVIYELVTGRRAVEAKSVAELVRIQEEGIAPPSHVVPDLDPAIDRAVLRCLERNPDARPASALAVAASLPGGDPLAAALAAGETPSPEMVAAAGANEALGPLPAIVALAIVLAALVLVPALADRFSITGIVPLDKPPVVLAERALEIARALGYPDEPYDAASGFGHSSDYLRHVRASPDIAADGRLASNRPPLVVYWHRTSPRDLVPTGERTRVSYSDPPFTISGMRGMLLDSEGRLVELDVVIPQMERGDGEARETDWSALFREADLDMSAFTRVTPQWTPRNHADERAAWEGPLPGWPDERLRVEAAAYQGRPVFFQLVMPWTLPSRMEVAPRNRTADVLQTLGTVFAIGILFGSLFVTRHNLRKGRGDRKGAARLATVVFCTTLASWAIAGKHVADLGVEIGRLFSAVGTSLWAAATLWVLYIALEPYVRRFWPSTLISWSRLVSGKINDPLVGRDVLVGIALGAVVTLMERGALLLRPMLGYGPPPPLQLRLSDLEGLPQLLGSLGSVAFNAPFNALWALFGMVILRLLFRRVWITAAATVLLFAVASAANFTQSGPVWLGILVGVTAISLVVLLMLKLGLLATIAFFFFSFAVSDGALTLDPRHWFFTTSAWTLAFGAGLALYGFYASRGGEPLLGRRILD